MINICIITSPCLKGQSEIEHACDLLYEKAESIDYRYDIEDQTVEGLLILPLYGSMPTGKYKSCDTLLILTSIKIVFIFSRLSLL